MRADPPRGTTQGLDREKRERLILASLLERRVGVEEELRDARAHLTEVTRREAELRHEIAALDGILGAIPAPPPAPPPPAAQASAPASAADVAPAPAARKRRRKGTRREEMLPKLRAKFGSGPFSTEEVTDALLEAEPGERRKAYFAAWSLVRDLAEDGVVAVVTEEGSGPRKRRSYRFADQA